MKLKKLSIITFTTFILSMGNMFISDAQKTDNINIENTNTSQNQEEKLNGWVKDEYFWYYYQNGNQLKDEWLLENGKWYYLNINGVMESESTHIENGVCYYFEADGSMTNKSGWIKSSDDDWYYGNGDGTVKYNQWLNLNGTWYYFEKWTGRMVHSETYEVDGIRYRFEESGAMSTINGWIKGNKNDLMYHDGYIPVDIDQIWLYLNGDGTIKSNEWIFENGVWYFIDEYGYMLYDTISCINGKYYYFKPNGIMETKLGWSKTTSYIIQEGFGIEGKYDSWFYVNEDGTLKADEWIFENGNWYYVHEEARMVADRSRWEIDGKEYAFDKNGVCLNPYI